MGDRSDNSYLASDLWAVAPPGFCNSGESEVWVYRGSRVRSPPVPVVLSVYQRGSLLDGLAMYSSCDTKKFYDNESTHILHNFWTSTHREEASPLPPGGATVCGRARRSSEMPRADAKCHTVCSSKPTDVYYNAPETWTLLSIDPSGVNASSRLEGRAL